MDKIIEYLKGKEEISLPDLQADLGMSYRELISTHQMLSRRGYVSEKIDGIRVKVNSRYVSPIEFGDDDIREFLNDLNSDELSLLQRIDCIFIDEDDTPPKFINLADYDGIKYLIRHNIVHEFEGKHYPSINKSSYEQLKKIFRYELDNGDDESSIFLTIGYQLFMRWIEDPKTAVEIMNLPYIPEESREYVEAKISVFELTGKVPTPPEEPMIIRYIKFAIIESFISQCFFFSKSEYNTEAETTLELIKIADIFSDRILVAMERATQDITDEMSITDIMEIRNIRGKPGIPDDD